MHIIINAISSLRKQYILEKNRDPVEHCKARIKTAQSMVDKLKRKNLPVNLNSALVNIKDAVGIRVICIFVDDIYTIINLIKSIPNIEVINDKDFISNPKPNGYRSYHLIVGVNTSIGEKIYIEIQVRTIGMDCWASLEHQLKYKKNIKNKEIFTSELKRCADEIASTDLSLQTIRDLIEKED